MKEKPAYLTISKELHRAIKVFAAKSGRRINHWVECKLRDALKCSDCGGIHADMGAIDPSGESSGTGRSKKGGK